MTATQPEYTLDQIAKITDAEWLQRIDAAAPIGPLLLDSRQIATPQTSLFFAIQGQRHDGHQFVEAAYRAGVRHFMVSQPVEVQHLPEANVLKVADTLAALQALAAHRRAQFTCPVIGITGSNGKTCVKEWLFQLLGRDFRAARSPRSYNSQVGVPLSVWGMDAGHDLGIFEAGISQTGEMEKVAVIIRPTIGIFTNIGPAHQAGFPSEAVKIAEKMRLFDHAHTLIYCTEHRGIAEAAERWAAEKPGRTLSEWSVSTARQFQIPFSDEASFENAGHCWQAARLLGLPEARLRRRMRHLAPLDMRLALKAGINRCTLIDDAYSNDLASLRIALQFAAQQARGQRIVLILSDMLQMDDAAGGDQPYREIADLLRQKSVSRLVAVGTRAATVCRFLPPDFAAHTFPNTEALLQHLQNLDFHDEVILLKGARAFAFERVARRLEQKAHQTVLEINLSALVHNLNVHTRLLQPGTKVLAMIKAAAYGSGSAEVAKLLEFHRVDYLGVAYADEGAELREAGIALPIMVLNPEPASFDTIYRRQLEPEVYSIAQLDALLAFVGAQKKLSIHLKLDTGMHRLGFEAADLQALTERLLRAPNLRVQSIFSHLAASDNPAHDAFTHQQASRFTELYAQIAGALGYQPLRHLVNTNGIGRFPEYHFDMARVGIGLYGVGAAREAAGLRPVHTLKATVSQVKTVPPGETVGYNRNSGTMATAARVATISIGYADGLLRLAGNGRYRVLVRGQAVPTLGNICMDMTMIDVSHLPEVAAGDEVVIFGENWPVERLAECLQTIPYEVLTHVTERVKRIYYQE